MRDARNEHERDVYQQRKEAGLCPRCGDPASDDHMLCPPCVQYQRGHTATAIAKLRADRRARGECTRCGRKTKRYECLLCLVKLGRLPKSRKPNATPTVKQSRTETVTEKDGYDRKRYVGRARRGAPSRADQNAHDHEDAMTSWARGQDAWKLAHDMTNDLTPAERIAATRVALDWFDNAGRFVDDIRDRTADHRQRSRQVARLREKMKR